MITRKDYMDDSSNLHHTYYMQFVNNHVYAIVTGYFSSSQTKTLRQHYKINDDVNMVDGITLQMWDNCYILTFVNSELLKEAGENRSLSTNICIVKAAMIHFLDNTKLEI